MEDQLAKKLEKYSHKFVQPSMKSGKTLKTYTYGSLLMALIC